MRRPHSFCPCISCACNRVAAAQDARVERVRSRYKIVMVWLEKDCDRKLARREEAWAVEREHLKQMNSRLQRGHVLELKKICAALTVLLLSGAIACLNG